MDPMTPRADQLYQPLLRRHHTQARCARCLRLFAQRAEESDQLLRCVRCGGDQPLHRTYDRKPALWRRIVRAVRDRIAGDGGGPQYPV